MKNLSELKQIAKEEKELQLKRDKFSIGVET